MYIAILIGILLFDQITKVIVAANNTNMTIIEGVFSFQYVKNPGAAFSFLADSGWAYLLFICISSVALVIMMVIFFRAKSRFLKLSIIILVAGAAGNLIDRIAFQYVRDFINIEFFANFNIADMAATAGVIMVIIYMLFLSKDPIIRLKKKDRDGKKEIDG